MTSLDRNDEDVLANMLLKSRRRSPYFGKDLEKARRATQFIGQGSPASSTAAYAIAAGHLANTGHYAANDTVLVSVEGNRRGRFNPIAETLRGNYRNVDLAISARARFIIDKPADRARPYNIGERQMAAYLASNGYSETSPGLFEG